MQGSGKTVSIIRQDTCTYGQDHLHSAPRRAAWPTRRRWLARKRRAKSSKGDEGTVSRCSESRQRFASVNGARGSGTVCRSSRHLTHLHPEYAHARVQYRDMQLCAFHCALSHERLQYIKYGPSSIHIDGPLTRCHRSVAHSTVLYFIL